jgi:hypothetical protein
MAYGSVNADTVTTSTAGGILGAGNATLLKNRLINGEFKVSQYNGTSAVTPSSDGYVIDRFKYQASQASKFTFQQNAGSVTPPVGFGNYLGATVASAVSIGASDYFSLIQKIEGFNTSDLGWGTANAKTITLSFQIYSSLTGTFGGALQNSAQNRSYPFTYTVSSANTWTTISVTIAGDTTGTWVGSTNGVGLQVYFTLGVGSTFSTTAGSWAAGNYFNATGATSVVGTSGATFYITGVQLEVGSSATGFEYRQYTNEYQLCQRYYIKITGSSATICNGGWSNSTLASLYWAFPTTMRTTPTLSSTSSGFTLQNLGPGADGANATVGSGNNFTTYGVAVQASCGSSGASVGYPCWLTTNASSSFLAASAEL